MRYNKLNAIRSIKVQELDDNKIKMTERATKNSKILLNDSELLRIVKHLSKPEENGDYPYIKDIISLKVGKSIPKYKQIRKNKGKLDVENYIFDNVGTDKDKKWEMKLPDNATESFTRLLTASGHTRSKKSIFVNSDLYDKVDDILRCGLPKDQEFEKLSKWNSYYGLASTDSKVVTMPNIVVIKDYKHSLADTFDVVEQSINDYGIKEYKLNPNVTKEYTIMPFDGAGLVSLEMAKQWRDDINKSIPEGKSKLDYIPASFQFRAIPCVKGNVYTFDIKEFAKEYELDTIIDVRGNKYNLSDFTDDEIDRLCILTESQFKFLDLYDKDNPIEDWKNKFITPCHGYNRTFNISEYSDKYEDLKHNMLTAYQHTQTINFTDDEIVEVCKTTVNMIKKISTNVDEFLKFRGLVENEDDDSIDWSNIPPYYKALSFNKSLFGDKYIQDKVKDDIKNIKNRALTSKLFVRGNYQVLTPDLFALAQWAFGDKKPTGLLAAKQIYSNYWNNQKVNGKKVRKVDIVRNPHIAHEHRIAKVVTNPKMKKWFQYQDTGIITSMYDTILLALNSADTDGDHIATICDSSIIAAVERVVNNGGANTIDFVPVPIESESEEKQADKSKKVIPKTNDIKALMDVDILGMSNDIGQVVNRVSELWSLEQTEIIQNYIKIMSIIASLTIDYAKTGEKADIPKDILRALKGVKKPYFMRYLPKENCNRIKEEVAINNAKNLGRNQRIIENQYKFSKTNCNTNRICWYLEKEIADIELITPKGEFDFSKIIIGEVDRYGDLYKRILNKLKELHEDYYYYTAEFKLDGSCSKEERKDVNNHYRYFYQYARYELLSLCSLENKKYDKVLDVLIDIYYSDADFLDKDKSILWNAFEREMLFRCKGEHINTKKLDIDTIITRRNKALEKIKKTKKAIAKKEVRIKIFKDNKKIISITEADRKAILKAIKKENKLPDGSVLVIKDLVSTRRILLLLLIFSRLLEEIKERNIVLKDKNGKALKDSNGNIVYEIDEYIYKPQIPICKNEKQAINHSNIAKLANVDKRKIDGVLVELEKLGLIKIFDSNLAKVKIKVLLPDVIDDTKVLCRCTDYLELAKLTKKFR